MPFHSVQYLLFLPVVVVLYHVLPPRTRWGLLLAASYVFYAAWRPAYLLLIVVSTLIDYTAALGIAATTRPALRRTWLVASLLTNLGILFVFKYAGFAQRVATAAGDALGLGFTLPAIDLVLPLGISFYTFQTIGYTIDVFRGHRPPERHIGRLALYVAFFPQLVAGPIERSTRLLPQFQRLGNATFDQLTSGARRVVWGLFKKLVIADWLAQTVDTVFAAPGDFHGLAVLLACYAFALQIYCDFSAYTDIAIGSARLFGIDLMENFRTPYLATSPRDFWRRWHISLSTWFRDYLYRPLGGNRVSTGRWAFNIMVVFVLAGLWHGANTTFLLWGVFHGVLVLGDGLFHRLFATKGGGSRISLPWLKFFGWAFTFHAVAIGFVLFRAGSIQDAWTLLAGLFSRGGRGLAEVADLVCAASAIALCGLAVLGTARVVRSTPRLLAAWESAPAWLRATAVYGLAASTLTFGRFGTKAFIYFQF